MNKFFSVLVILCCGVFSLILSSCSQSSSLPSKAKPPSSSDVKVIQRPLPTSFAESYMIIKDGLDSIGVTSLDLVNSGFNKEKIYTDSDGKSYRIRGTLVSTKGSDGKITLNGALAVFNGVCEVLLDFKNIPVSLQDGKVINAKADNGGKVDISYYNKDLAEKYSLKDIVDFKHSKLDGKTTLSCSDVDNQKCTDLAQAQTQRVSESGCAHLVKFFS